MPDIKTIDRALLAALSAGIAVFIIEFFFPDINKFISIAISALAAYIGYTAGGKWLAEGDEDKSH